MQKYNFEKVQQLLTKSCLLWDYAGAQQTQKWVLTVSYWMDLEPPMEDLEKVPKELKGSAIL